MSIFMFSFEWNVRNIGNTERIHWLTPLINFLALVDDDDWLALFHDSDLIVRQLIQG